MPDPTTQDLITETRTKLDQLIAQVATLQAAINTQIPPALTSTLITTRNKLQELITKLQADLDRLEEYQEALLLNPNTATSTQLQAAVELFEITLAPTDSLNDPDKWGKIERLQQAYQAVRAIVTKIATYFLVNSIPDTMRGLLLFIDNFGGTEIQLVRGEFEDSPTSAASTKMVDRNGIQIPVIFLYMAPWDNNNNPIQNYLHTTANITHEFGHVIVLRNGGDNSEIYKEWFVSWDGVAGHLGIGQYISPPFPPEEGWGDNAGNLQNTIPFTGSELENERIANMFEAFVTGYQPEINAGDSRQQRAAWALWTFMTGAEPPNDVWIDGQQNTRPIGSGMLRWIQLYSA